MQSDVEKQLVSNVMASSLDHHERELVQKQNELRRVSVENSHHQYGLS